MSTRTKRSRHLPWRHGVIAVVIGFAAMLVGVGPATATMYERFTYADEEHDAVPICGFDLILYDLEYSGKGHIRTGKGKLAGAFFLQDNYSALETYTNPENGRYLTISHDGVFQDLKATRVDGSIFEFVSHEVGQPFVVRDMDGSVVLRDRGAITWTYLFDTGGDDEPGGEEVAELDTRVSGPHPAFFLDEAEGCALMRELIG